jgi:hypothetical protein
MNVLNEHVERFNAGVRSGDFGPMLEPFADDAELAFEGIRGHVRLTNGDHAAASGRRVVNCGPQI